MAPANRSHRPLVHRLAAARGISLAGSEAAFIGLVATTLTTTGSPYWVAAVLAAWLVIGGFAAPIAGTIGDRYDRRRVMIASDLAGAACFAFLAALHTPAWLLVFAALAALCEAPFAPASSAAVPNLAPADDLAWANGFVSAGSTIGRLAGPVLGGVLIAGLGPGAAFSANAISFLVSAALVASMHGRFTGSRADGDSGGMMDGFRFVAATPFLRSMVVAWSIFLVGVGMVIVSEFPLARLLDAGPVGYGLLASGWGAGGLVGSLLAARVIRKLGSLRSLVWGAFAAAIAIAFVGTAGALAVAVAWMAIAGATNSVSSVSEETIVQQATPDKVRSRVLAAQEAAWVGSLGVGLVVGGFVVSALGPRVAYGTAGVLGVIGSLTLWAALRAGHRPVFVSAET